MGEKQLYVIVLAGIVILLCAVVCVMAVFKLIAAKEEAPEPRKLEPKEPQPPKRPIVLVRPKHPQGGHPWFWLSRRQPVKPSNQPSHPLFLPRRKSTAFKATPRLPRFPGFQRKKGVKR